MITAQAAGITVTRISLPELFILWSEYRKSWLWHNPFITPPWLKSWWRHFADDNESLLLLVSEGKHPLGVAPLMQKNGTARFMGSVDLCDTGDFIAAPRARELFSQEILRFLAAEGVHRLVLEQVRPDSVVYNNLIPTAETEGWRVSVVSQAASVEMELPPSWEEYLQQLAAKQRHEVRRKLRRAHDAGVLNQLVIRTASETAEAMDVFIHLFCQSRVDKMEFMTKARKGFFRSLAAELSQQGMLHLLSLTLDDQPAAAVFCVEVGETTYLYNNGFDPRFRKISLGGVSKLMTIRSSIEAGQNVYDFLGGTERYKYQLGGTEIPLMKCIIERENL